MYLEGAIFSEIVFLFGAKQCKLLFIFRKDVYF